MCICSNLHLSSSTEVNSLPMTHERDLNRTTSHRWAVSTTSYKLQRHYTNLKVSFSYTALVFTTGLRKLAESRLSFYTAARGVFLNTLSGN